MRIAIGFAGWISFFWMFAYLLHTPFPGGALFLSVVTAWRHARSSKRFNLDTP